MAVKEGRNFLGVLYPDSESYDCQKVLSRIEDTFVDFAYIVHDMDVNENGEIKKTHIHWCGKKSSPAPLSTISIAHMLTRPQGFAFLKQSPWHHFHICS